MNQQELSKYALMFNLHFNGPVKQTSAFTFKKIKNGEHTDNRFAWNNASWIEYWQALSRHFGNGMRCTCCGKQIYADIDKINHQALAIISGLQERQAVGAHICNPNYNAKSDEPEYYIAPLCKECNAKTTPMIPTINNFLVPEIGETVKEEDKGKYSQL